MSKPSLDALIDDLDVWLKQNKTRLSQVTAEIPEASYQLLRYPDSREAHGRLFLLLLKAMRLSKHTFPQLVQGARIVFEAETLKVRDRDAALTELVDACKLLCDLHDRGKANEHVFGSLRELVANRLTASYLHVINDPDTRGDIANLVRRANRVANQSIRMQPGDSQAIICLREALEPFV